MKAKAVCHGAATVVNAISNGRGSAFGIGLKTEAEVKLNDSGTISGTIGDDPKENTHLIELCVKKTLENFGMDYGAEVETNSEIPIARGLKSSSIAANAAVLATLGALKKEHEVDLTDLEIINIGIDAALEAKVTITGAFDDASASFFGGLVLTDNIKRELIRKETIDEYEILVFITDQKSHTEKIDVGRTKILRREVDEVWKLAKEGKIWEAMTINGILYGTTLKHNNEVALAALKAGALSCGLSGTGPAFVAVCDSNTDEVEKALSQFEGEIIRTKTNNKKAYLVD